MLAQCRDNQPNVQSSVQEAKDQPAVFGFPVQQNPFRILGSEIHLQSEVMCVLRVMRKRNMYHYWILEGTEQEIVYLH